MKLTAVRSSVIDSGTVLFEGASYRIAEHRNAAHIDLADRPNGDRVADLLERYRERSCRPHPWTSSSKTSEVEVRLCPCAGATRSSALLLPCRQASGPQIPD